MTYEILADLVVIVHFLFILFMAFGGLFTLRWNWTPWVHLPAALWGVLLELSGWFCPLTPLETRLRRAAGAEGYEGSFVEHYVLPVIYPTELTRDVQIVLGLVLVGVNVLVYAFVWWARSRRVTEVLPRRPCRRDMPRRSPASPGGGPPPRSGSRSSSA